MHDRFASLSGRTLDRPEYHADLAREFAAHSGTLWKLERAQHFSEVGDPAWDAFLAGDWERVLALFELDREPAAQEVAAEAERGAELRRLRLVEHPPSPYLRWEMHSLRVFSESGRHIRVLDAAKAADHETGGPLPELLILGATLLYNVRYTEDMEPIGAVRIDDPAAVHDMEVLVAGLYDRAEPVQEYFAREIAPLGPPDPPQ